MDSGLLVRGGQDGRMSILFGSESSMELEFEALGDLVLELYGGFEDVGGGPGLGEI